MQHHWCWALFTGITSTGAYRNLQSTPGQVEDEALDSAQLAGTRRSWKDPERMGENRRWMRSQKEHTFLLWPHSPPVLSLSVFLHWRREWQLASVSAAPSCSGWQPTSPLCCHGCMGYLLLPFFMSQIGVPILYGHQEKNDRSGYISTNRCFVTSFTQPWGAMDALDTLQILWKSWNSSKNETEHEAAALNPSVLTYPANCSL